MTRGSLGLALALLVSCAGAGSAPADRANGVAVSPPVASAPPASPSLTTSMVDVRAFGARGDGLVDDTRAIQRAIDSAPRGATVYVPPGTYSIASAPLVLKSDIRLLGAGRASTLHEPTGNRSIVSVNDDENVTVESLRFTGSGTRVVAGRGAIWAAIGRSFGTRNSRFVDNVIEGVGTSGIVVGNSTNTIVSGNVIATTEEHGIYVSESSDVLVTHNTISHIGAESCGACAGVKLANVMRVRIAMNVIDAPSQDGILFDNGSVDSQAIDNTISGAGQYGIRLLANTSGNLVAENHLEYSRDDAIHAASETNEIRDNVITQAGGAYR